MSTENMQDVEKNCLKEMQTFTLESVKMLWMQKETRYDIKYHEYVTQNDLLPDTLQAVTSAFLYTNKSQLERNAHYPHEDNINSK